MYKGSRAICILMALAATGTECAVAADTASDHFRVETQIVSLPASAVTDFPDGTCEGYFSPDFVAQMDNRPTANILLLANVEAIGSSPCHVDTMQQFVLAGCKSRETGIKLDVVPDKKDANAGFLLSFRKVTFQGYEDQKATIPIFRVANLSTTIQPSTHPVYLCFNIRNIGAQGKTKIAYDADGRQKASIADANELQLLFVKITRG